MNPETTGEKKNFVYFKSHIETKLEQKATDVAHIINQGLVCASVIQCWFSRSWRGVHKLINVQERSDSLNLVTQVIILKSEQMKNHL